MDKTDWIFIGIVLFILAICGIGTIHEESKRNQWRKDHHCKIIGQISGSSHFGMAFTGKGMAPVTMFESGKTGYVCDDGLQYWE